MANSINVAIIVGKIGRDAETVFTPSGISKTTFSVATEYGYKKDNEWVNTTTWHNVVMWRNEKLADRLQKGVTVAVSGRIENRSYDDKNGVKKYISEIIAESVVPFFSPRPSEAEGSGEVASRPRQSQVKQQIGDDDIPF
jgi:single-strand DNA-binding protein